MKTKYGIPQDALDKICERDIHCVYCNVTMTTWRNKQNNENAATIEHVYPPAHDPTWIFLCCYSCNLQHKKPLREWFKTEYCIRKNINEKTVAAPVKKFLKSGLKEYDQIWMDKREHNFINDIEWTYAKTMPGIPHEYVVYDSLSNKDKKSFDKIKSEVDRYGYTGEFSGKQYKYGKYYGYKYWFIDNILNREKE